MARQSKGGPGPVKPETAMGTGDLKSCGTVEDMRRAGRRAGMEHISTVVARVLDKLLQGTS